MVRAMRITEALDGRHELDLGNAREPIQAVRVGLVLELVQAVEHHHHTPRTGSQCHRGKDLWEHF
eukprot:CAMPEP_0202089408 /NCGR_PEP_ID=MMETSP0964-20121228/41045_1 /ASSEMBLY_ACC=CAM_ASM_000500 /TAXON_ID=4773 /ORGANISM="Schizochytrium aggregatum, Strain ATCC28209" /LENGTH=64 /DNA_ID=CAMNT_0048657485 /DNA_START=15 /DNA_END=206 /DNA_ORIENTATION=+